MLVLFSFIVYLLGGAIASYIIVRRKPTEKPIFEGIKVGIGTIIILVLIVFPRSEKRSLGATLAVMASTFIGSLLGTLMPQLRKIFHIIFGRGKPNSEDR